MKSFLPSPLVLRPRLLLILLASLALFTAPAGAAKPPTPATHWVGTWAASPYSADNKDNRFATDTTLRQIVHVSLGGVIARVEFTNEFGTEPLTIGAAHIALTSTADSISLPSASALTFGGNPSITIPPGASVLSDPAGIKLPPFSNLTVTLFLPAQTISKISQHGAAYQTNYMAPGNMVGAASLSTAGADVKNVNSWLFLKGVDVQAPAGSGAIVALGDSITDGAHSTANANARWPDVLARRLAADKKTRDLAVLNEGIGGNRLLHDNTGPSALARFDRDVLSHPGVRFLILMEGINDIGHAADPKRPYDVVSAPDLIQALAQLSERAHAHGIKVLGATLTPYVGAGYSSPAGEAMRQAVNQWIRTCNQLDGVIDFDKATEDPAHPGAFRPSDDSGDHLHPGDTGYKDMGNAINLKLFASPGERYDIRREP